MAFLSLENVAFRYEQMEMLFDLEVEEGECLAIVGASGSGKSTLLSLIAGFDAPLDGKILKQGRDIAHLPPQERGIAVLFQDNNLFPHLNVWENVRLGLRHARGQDEIIRNSLRIVGLDQAYGRLPGELSGGERQRIALARSLLTHASLLLLDEPFGALGPALKKEILLLTDRIRQENGLTVLLVSHEPAEVLAIATRIAFIDNGRVVAVGKPEAILSSPHPAIRAYLGSFQLDTPSP